MHATNRRGSSRALPIRALIVIATIILAAVPPLIAHHAFSSEFDASQPVRLTGTVTQMEWVNPHGWIHVNVRQQDGAVKHWAVEVATPNTLLRRGLRKADLVVGTTITIDGYQAKDRGLRAHGTYLTLTDGRRIFLSSALADVGDDQR